MADFWIGTFGLSDAVCSWYSVAFVHRWTLIHYWANSLKYNFQTWKTLLKLNKQRRKKCGVPVFRRVSSMKLWDLSIRLCRGSSWNWCNHKKNLKLKIENLVVFFRKAAFRNFRALNCVRAYFILLFGTGWRRLLKARIEILTTYQQTCRRREERNGQWWNGRLRQNRSKRNNIKNVVRKLELWIPQPSWKRQETEQQQLEISCSRVLRGWERPSRCHFKHKHDKFTIDHKRRWKINFLRLSRS